MASSRARTLLRKTCSTGTLYGSHFSARDGKIDGGNLDNCRLTDAEDVDLPPVVVLLRQHALDLHLEHLLELGRRRHKEQLRRVLLHPVVLLQHLERLLDVELLRAEEPQQKSLVLSALVTQIAARHEAFELVKLRRGLVVLV